MLKLRILRVKLLRLKYKIKEIYNAIIYGFEIELGRNKAISLFFTICCVIGMIILTLLAIIFN